MPRGRWRGREEIKIQRPSVRRGGKEVSPCGSAADAEGCAEEHMSVILFLYSCNDGKLSAPQRPQTLCRIT